MSIADDFHWLQISAAWEQTMVLLVPGQLLQRTSAPQDQMGHLALLLVIAFSTMQLSMSRYMFCLTSLFICADQCAVSGQVCNAKAPAAGICVLPKAAGAACAANGM